MTTKARGRLRLLGEIVIKELQEQRRYEVTWLVSLWITISGMRLMVIHCGCHLRSP
jgi:hypothetical protein